MSGTETEQNKDTSRLPSLPPPSLPGTPGLAPPSQPVTPVRPMLAPPTLPPLVIQPVAHPAPVLTYETPVLPSIESASDDAFFAAAEVQLDVSNSSVLDATTTELDYTFGLPAILDVTPPISSIDASELLAAVPPPIEELNPELAPSAVPSAAAVPVPVEELTPGFVPAEVPSVAAIPLPVEELNPELAPSAVPSVAAVPAPVEELTPEVEPTPEPTLATALPIEAAPVTPAAVPDVFVETESEVQLVPSAPAEAAPMIDALEPIHAAAPQHVMGLPSLPGAGASPVAPTAAVPAIGTQPSQAGMRAPLPMSEPMAPTAPVAAKAPRRPVRAIVRSLAAVVLAAGVGAGAHLGYDWWESDDAAVVVGEIPVDASDLASWPVVDPPAIRYADTVTVVRDITGYQRVVTSHLEIATGSMLAEVDAMGASGVSLGRTGVDIRGEEALMQQAPDAAFTPTTRAEALATLGDTWNSDIYSVRELFPMALMPYATVLESVERVLPVAPLVAPAAVAEAAPEAAPASTVPIATSTTPTSSVWQYRVIIDVEAFSSNDMAAYQEWQRRVGRNAVPRLEAWVDTAGIVRQITLEIDGRTVTHTLVSGSANSDRFVAPVPTTPVAPVTPDPAPIPTPDAQPDAQPEVES